MSGRHLIVIGLIITAVGIIMTLGPRMPYIGRLPGDIFYKKGNFSFYFPLATSIIISIILSLIFYLLSRR